MAARIVAGGPSAALRAMRKLNEAVDASEG